MNPILAFDHVSFAYSDKTILRDVSFTIDKGEFIGVIGPNGGGKTTLLKLIMGFLKPQKGTITLFNGHPDKSLDKVSYVPQNLSFDRKFPISVDELVLSGLLSKLPWYGRYNRQQKDATREAMEMMGITALQNRSLGTLSGGQMQRALIARSLVSQPEILLLDEPTANVDTQAEADIYSLLQKLAGDVTIIMVTHDLKTSIEQVDRVLCVQNDVSTFKTKEVCEHFALGLYHAPLLANKNSNNPCCSLQIPQEKDKP
jgi:zinc transport system ATP-binding protein